jgi:hypothetical protein
MLRFKVFSGSSQDVERKVNHWLAEYEPDIAHMAQTGTDDSLVISIVFDESFRGQEIRLSEEHAINNATGPAVPAGSIPDEPLIVPQEPGMVTT